MVRIGLFLAFLAVGCGSSSSEKREAGKPGGGEGGGGSSAAAGPLTQADCDRLVDHWLELYIADRKKTAKPEEVPTEEDVAKTRQRMTAASKDNCVGAPRAPYDCSMRAHTIEEARVCLEGAKPP